ncbi:MAG TPA: MFS transporter [Gemmataceae bacterium]|jgi:MFS family permease|nr:MFS transporter [Gemmataceae bacterium]
MPAHGTTGSSPGPTANLPGALFDGQAPARGLPFPRLGASLTAAFRALRHRNYRLYFFGQLASVTGSWMQTTALGWLAYELTHQSKWTALVMAAQMLPTFFLGPWGGALADRLPKRSVIFVTQAAFMVLALLLAGLVFGRTIDPWLLLLITTAAGLVQAVDLPARLSFVNDMAGRNDLMNAVALNSLLFNVARVLGPALAGLMLMVPDWGAGACFLVNGLSYLAVLWALRRMDVVGSVKHADNGRALGARRPSLLGGFRYLVRRPGLTYLVALAAMLSLCGWPFLALLPALADSPLDRHEWGYSVMLSATGVGALAAALIVAARGSLARRRRFISTGLTVLTAGIIGLSLAGNLALAGICTALVGFGLIMFFITGQSVLQLSADDHNRGRVMAVWAMTQSGALPLGTMLSGLAADEWGVPVVLRVNGIACGAVALLLLAGLRLWTRLSPSRQLVGRPESA